MENEVLGFKLLNKVQSFNYSVKRDSVLKHGCQSRQTIANNWSALNLFIERSISEHLIANRSRKKLSIFLTENRFPFNVFDETLSSKVVVM